jgi:hypothetical protein
MRAFLSYARSSEGCSSDTDGSRNECSFIELDDCSSNKTSMLSPERHA